MVWICPAYIIDLLSFNEFWTFKFMKVRQVNLKSKKKTSMHGWTLFVGLVRDIAKCSTTINGHTRHVAPAAHVAQLATSFGLPSPIQETSSLLYIHYIHIYIYIAASLVVQTHPPLWIHVSLFSCVLIFIFFPCFS